MSLDEVTITWNGHLKFKMRNVVSGYACKMNTHAAEGLKLKDTVTSLLNRNLRQNHHTYKAIFIIV